jgi:hypothetical protein
LLDSAKVRKDLALKGSAKCLAKIKHLIQAYAIARPTIRFRLHVLKAKNSRSDFIYAPKTNANVEDAALKIIGKECALQCDWTAFEWEGFELHAFLPKPTAIGYKVSNHGAFISIDSRPVSSVRGTLKKIAAAVKDKMRKASPALANVKDPFFSLNITCPMGSYDPNIEPAKNDVIFCEECSVLAAVNRLLNSYYLESIDSIDLVTESGLRDTSPIQPNHLPSVEDAFSEVSSSHSVLPDKLAEDSVIPDMVVPTANPRWRSSMYGIDEEDLEFLPSNTHVAVEEEEGSRNADISNPWTIARMNAPIKSKKSIANRQLQSPAKSQGDTSSAPQPPAPAATPRQSTPVEPLTPPTISQADQYKERVDNTLRLTPTHFQDSGPSNLAALDHTPDVRPNRTHDSTLSKQKERSNFSQPTTHGSISDATCVAAARQRDHRPFKPLKPRAHVSPVPLSDDTWFGQPMRNAPKPTRSTRRSPRKESTFFPYGGPSRVHKLPIVPAADRLVERETASKSNTDIRGMFSQPRRTPTDLDFQSRIEQPQYLPGQSSPYAERGDSTRTLSLRPRSAESYNSPSVTAQEMDKVFLLHQSTVPSQKPSLRQSPITFSLESEAKPRAPVQRRQTTDGGMQRTKSSTLPLNFTPRGTETHNSLLQIETSVPTLVRQARKLDITVNSLEWGYDCTDAFDTFASAISERTIMNWVIQVDNLLYKVFERVDGVDVRGAIHEGVQRFIDLRRDEEEVSHARAVINMDTDTQIADDESITSHDSKGKLDLSAYDLAHTGIPGAVHSQGKGKGAAAAIDAKFATGPDDYDQDFDSKEFVDLNGNAGSLASPVRSIKTEDEFGDDIDDEMLLDV